MIFDLYRSDSLRHRVLFWFAFAISLLLVIFGSAFYYLMEERMEFKTEEKLYMAASSVQSAILSGRKLSEAFSPVLAQGMEAAFIRGSETLFKTPGMTDEIVRDMLGSKKSFVSHEIDEYTIDAIYRLDFEREKNGTLILFEKSLPNRAEDMEDILLWLGPALLLLLLFSANRALNEVFTPINRITDAVKAVSIDNFSHKLNLPFAYEETKELIEAFNDMIKRLEEGVENLDRFNSDISHELKTPLTVLRGELELALRKDANGQEREKSIRKSLKELSEIERLIDSLLLLGRYSESNIYETFEHIYFDSMILDLCEKFSKKMRDKEIELKIERLEAVESRANSALTRSIFANLIENAIEYGSYGGSVGISLYREHGSLFFEIVDDGIGMRPEEIERVTERFYRVDQSRKRSDGGFGLGLSIVKKAVELHGGRLEIESRYTLYTKVRIELPLFGF